MNAWYVVYTQAMGELKALMNLQRQGFDAYLPRYRKQRRHARKVDRVAAPLFPRYLFVNMDIAKARWRAINSTFGVSHLVATGDSPVPLLGSIVDSIRAREDDGGMIALHDEDGFKRGDKVWILDGPLGEQEGLFDRHSDDARVTVLLDILGRTVKVRVAKDEVSAYA
jgi:transcriptional antiterminator RfaH